MPGHRASTIPSTGRGSGDGSWAARKPVADGRRGRGRAGTPKRLALRGGQDNDAVVLVAAERECQELLARVDARLKTDAADMEPILGEIGK